MHIDLSNVSTDQSTIESGVWHNDAGMLPGLITADVVLFQGERLIKEHCVDLLKFYFDFRDALVQVVLRGMMSHVRINFEVVCTFAPLKGGEHSIAVMFPNTYDQNAVESQHLSLEDIRTVIRVMEICISKQLLPYRQPLFAAFEESQSASLFDVLRIVDQDVELSSESLA